MVQEAEIPGAVVGGTYRLVRPLASEPAQVYEARHDRLSGRFVVKLVADAEPEAFQRNAQLVSALRHPGVVQVIDYSAAEGLAFVVMEYIDGRPLSELIAETGIMPADRVARLIDNVASGLAAAHELGLAHGHLQPQRILVQASGSRREKTKVVGLGLGSEISGVPDLTEVTPYTAPEQAGDPPEPASDQFALAAIAYEMLTGFPPFDDNSEERQEPASIRDYAPGVNVIVDDVIRKALSEDPADRWPDITMFAQRLREAGDSNSLEEKTRVTAMPLRSAPAADTPTPVDGVEDADGFELPAPSTPLPELPPEISALDEDPGTSAPWSLSGTLLPRSPAPYRQPHLPPPGGSTGFVLPPPSQPALPVLRHQPSSYAGVDSGPWTVAPGPGPALSLSGDGTGLMLSVPARRGGRRRANTGGLLVLGATAALIAFVLVKTDVIGTHRGAEHTKATPAPALAAPTPPAGATPEGTARAAVAPAAEPTAPAPADEGATAEALGKGPAQPQVVPLAGDVVPPASADPAPEARPRRRTASHRRRPLVGAPLPPELAAEEALLSGGPPPERRSVKSRKKVVRHALRDTSDPWAE